MLISLTEHGQKTHTRFGKHLDHKKRMTIISKFYLLKYNRSITARRKEGKGLGPKLKSNNKEGKEVKYPGL